MYLRFFEDDDQKYEETIDKYSRGELLTGEVKAHLITVSSYRLYSGVTVSKIIIY
jgi:hypothetical protein